MQYSVQLHGPVAVASKTKRGLKRTIIVLPVLAVAGRRALRLYKHWHQLVVPLFEVAHAISHWLHAAAAAAIVYFPPLLVL
jgi:hypothetical protein